MTTSSVFGVTRTHVGPRHALIGPDGHVPSLLPGVEKATSIVLISAEMGARLSHPLLTFSAGGQAAFPANEAEAFAYILSGSVRVEVGGNSHELNAGSYVFSPAGQTWKLKEPVEGTQVNMFVKKYVPLAGFRTPESIVGHES